VLDDLETAMKTTTPASRAKMMPPTRSIRF
jgi:hypothetical protein